MKASGCGSSHAQNHMILSHDSSFRFTDFSGLEKNADERIGVFERGRVLQIEHSEINAVPRVWGEPFTGSAYRINGSLLVVRGSAARFSGETAQRRAKKKSLIASVPL
jgi:hypothetical protein